MFTRGYPLAKGQSIAKELHHDLLEVQLKWPDATFVEMMMSPGKGLQELWPRVNAQIVLICQFVDVHPTNTGYSVGFEWF